MFTDNAADFVDVGYKRSLRRGVMYEDITVVEVSMRLMYMVEDINVIDKHRVTLETQSSGEPVWRVTEESPVIRGGVYTWSESNQAPCHDHR